MVAETMRRQVRNERVSLGVAEPAEGTVDGAKRLPKFSIFLPSFLPSFLPCRINAKRFSFGAFFQSFSNDQARLNNA